MYFIKIKVLIPVNLRGIKMASGSSTQNEAGFVLLLKGINSEA